ncbi:hypothetical protein L1987_70184 [Smallanthus sonchifolius]|uniref:Uncharacterized protein n=1 Tax=Smallanthus sonchifolius TaxID=185202 RepID=A0ACB9APS8_9ASTR|nr:hypothetical protein L1987_70184 [Smallanthus sonchifolius]
MAYLKLNPAVVTAIVVAYMHFLTTVAYTSYLVGGARGWIVPPNPNHYEAWMKGKKFFKGDTFYFVHERGEHTVAKVTVKETYDTCNTTAVEHVYDVGTDVL